MKVMRQDVKDNKKTMKHVIGAGMWSDKGEILDEENEASFNFGKG